MDLEHPSGSIKLFGVTIFPHQNPLPPPIAAAPIRSGNPNSDHADANPAKRPRRSVPMMPPPPPPQPLPQEYRDLLLQMGASVDDPSPVLVFSRALFNSDVKKALNRLNIPAKQILKPFLTQGEEYWVQQKDVDGKTPKKLGVTVIDPLLVERTMSLAKWNWKQEEKRGKKQSWWYALTNNWMEVVDANGLAAGDSIQLWSFRIKGHLGFIIHKVAVNAAPPSDQPQSSNGVVLDGSTSTDQGDPGSSSSAAACA